MKEHLSDQDIERLVHEAEGAVARDAKIPSASLVYWKASIRARSDAARKVEQPLTIIQALAAAVIVGAGVALGGLAMKTFSPAAVPALPELSPLTTLALLVATLVVISPLALVAVALRTRFDRPQD